MNFIEKIKNTKSLKVNAIFNSIYQILSMLVPLVTAPYISRVLGVVNNGYYAYYYSITTYFVLFATFGFNDFGTKYIAEVRDDRAKTSSRFWAITFSKLILGLLVIFIYLLFSYFTFGDNEIGLNLLLICSGFIISSVIDPTFFFQGKEKFVSISLRNIFIRIITTVLIFCIVRNSNDLYTYAFIMSLGQIFASLIMFFSFKGEKITLPKFNKNDLIESFKGAFSYFLPALAVTLFNSLNQTLLGLFGYEGEESGYFGQAIKIISILATFVGSINVIVLSRISYLQALNDEEGIKKQTGKIFQVFWVASLPIMFGLMAISNIFIPAFFGEEYAKATISTLILAPVVILSPLNGLIGSIYYRPKNKIYLQTSFIIIASVVNIIVCVILIPELKSYGAAIGRLSAEIMQLPLLIVFSYKYINYRQIAKNLVKPFFSSLIMGTCVFLTVTYIELNDWVLIVIGIVLGVVAYYFLELILKDKFVLDNTKVIINFIKKKLNKKS